MAATASPAVGVRLFLPRAALAELIEQLLRDGYQVVAPRIEEGTVLLRPIRSADELPRGVRDRQEGGTYRLEPGDESLAFEYVVGPDGPKRWLFPPAMKLLQFRVTPDRFELEEGPPQTPKFAFLGIRPCELAAIRVLDRVLGHDDPRTFRCESEPWYAQARRQALLIAVNCTRPGGTCFCASRGTGPQARDGFDLALTELRDGFVVDVGSERGSALAARLPVREAAPAELELADVKLERAAERMGRALPEECVKELLDRTLEHPEWDAVARRCLSCGNCTWVCPTCFCSTVTDVTDLAGEGRVARVRQWESCFTLQFSYTTAGPGRDSIRGRYRQWLRHKLGTWHDQFGMSGCVGCGRCITWCPVGIDLTEEVRRLRGEDGRETHAAKEVES